MAKLLNEETGAYEIFPQDEVPQALKTGKYGFNDEDSFEFYNSIGERKVLQGKDAFDAFNNPRYSIVPEDLLTQEKLESEYGGTKGEALAFVEGLASDMTFGASDAFLVESGLVKPETLKRHRELNPAAYLSGEITGLTAPTPWGYGIRALKTAGKLGKIAGLEKIIKSTGEIGQKGLDLVSKNKIFQDIAKKGAKATADLYAYEVGRNISDTFIEDKPITAEIMQTSPDVLAWGFGIPTALNGLKIGSKKVKEISKSTGITAKIEQAKQKANKFIEDNLIRVEGETKYKKFLNLFGVKKVEEKLFKGRVAESLESIESKIKSGEYDPDYLTSMTSKEKEIIASKDAKLKDFVNFFTKFVDRGSARKTGEQLAEEIKQTSGKYKNLANKTLDVADFEIPKNINSKASTILGNLNRAKEVIGSEVSRLREFIKSTADEYRTWFPNLTAKGYRPLEFSDIPKNLVEKFRSKLSVDGKKKLDFVINETNKSIETFGDLINEEVERLRTELSKESSYGLNPKDNSLFWEMKNYVDDFVVGYYQKEKNRIVGGLTDFFKGKDYVKKAIDSLNSPEFPDQIKEIVRINLGKAGEGKETFNRIQFIKDLKKELNILPQIKEYHQAMTNYHYSKISEDLITGVQNKEISKSVSIKEIIKARHVAAGMISKPLGAAFFAMDKALDSEKVKLMLMRGLYNTEEAIYKKIGTSISNMVEKLPKKTKRGAYPFISRPDSFDKNYEEVANMEMVDANNIDQITSLNSALAGESPEVFGEYISKHNQIVQFLQSKLPRTDFDVNGEMLPVSSYEKMKFNRYYEAVKNPLGIIDRVEDFTASKEDIEVLKTVYPAIYQVMLGTLTELLPYIKMKGLTYNDRVFLTNTFGMAFTNTMLHQNTMLLQSNMARQTQQAQQMQQPPQNSRPRNLPVTQYKGMLNRNATSLQKTNSRQ